MQRHLIATLITTLAVATASHAQPVASDMPAETVVDRPFDKPLIVVADVAKETKKTDRGRAFSKRPELVLNFSVPLEDVTFRSLSDEPIWVESLYANKTVNESFEPQPTFQLEKAEGRYVIRLSAQGTGKVGVAVYAESTPRDKTAVSTLLPADVPLARRDVYNWLPLLGKAGLAAKSSETDQLRTQVLMTLPKTLFVTPKMEITAAALFGVKPTAKTPTPGDALLLVSNLYPDHRATVMTIDGTEVAVDDRFLDVPAGKLSLGATASNATIGTATSFTALYGFLSEEDRKPFAALRADYDKAGACYLLATSKLDPAFAGHKKAFKTADKACKYNATYKRADKAKAKMAPKATATLQKQMAAIQARLESL